MTINQNMGRRALIAAALCGAVLRPAQAQAATPMTRIKIMTIGAADPKAVALAYEKWLGYKVRESGRVPKAMADSWGAPKNAGQDYFLLSPDGSPNIFIRVIGTGAVPGYASLTAAGWNGIELIVDDVNKLYVALKNSPFIVKAPPISPVKGFPTILSMTAEGPAHETLYLTCETGDRSKAWLALPNGPVGRPVVAWIAGPDILLLRDWYADTFSMARRPAIEMPVKGSLDGTTMPNTTMMLSERSNAFQFEGNPAQFGPRRQAAGLLPPGNAMTSVVIESLEAVKAPFITAPRVLYGKSRAATVMDPQGNRIEVIEERGA